MNTNTMTTGISTGGTDGERRVSHTGKTNTLNSYRTTRLLEENGGGLGIGGTASSSTKGGGRVDYFHRTSVISSRSRSPIDRGNIDIDTTKRPSRRSRRPSSMNETYNNYDDDDEGGYYNAYNEDSVGDNLNTSLGDLLNQSGSKEKGNNRRSESASASARFLGNLPLNKLDEKNVISNNVHNRILNGTNTGAGPSGGGSKNKKNRDNKIETDVMKAAWQKERDMLNQQVSALEAALKRKQDRHDLSRGTAVESRKEGGRLQGELKKAGAVIDKLRIQLRDTEKAAVERGQRIRELENKIAQLSRDDDNVREIDRLTKELSRVSESDCAARDELVTKNLTISSMSENLAAIKQALTFKAKELGFADTTLLYEYGQVKEGALMTKNCVHFIVIWSNEEITKNMSAPFVKEDCEQLKVQIRKSNADLELNSKELQVLTDEVEDLTRKYKGERATRIRLEEKYGDAAGNMEYHQQNLVEIRAQKADLENRLHVTLDHHSEGKKQLIQNADLIRQLESKIAEYEMQHTKIHLEGCAHAADLRLTPHLRRFQWNME